MSMEMVLQKERRGDCGEKSERPSRRRGDGTGTLPCHGKEQRMRVRQVGRFGGGKVGFSTEKEVGPWSGSSTADTHGSGRSHQAPSAPSGPVFTDSA